MNTYSPLVAAEDCKITLMNNTVPCGVQRAGEGLKKPRRGKRAYGGSYCRQVQCYMLPSKHATLGWIIVTLYEHGRGFISVASLASLWSSIALTKSTHGQLE